MNLLFEEPKLSFCTLNIEQYKYTSTQAISHACKPAVTASNGVNNVSAGFSLC